MSLEDWIEKIDEDERNLYVENQTRQKLIGLSIINLKVFYSGACEIILSDASKIRFDVNDISGYGWNLDDE